MMSKWLATLLLLFGPVAHAADLYVDARFGSDGSGDGSAQNPYKSLTFASAGTTLGDFVFAGPGRYDVANGEVFPISIPIGVSLIGTDARFVIIDGGGAAQGTGNVVDLNEATWLEGVTVTGSGADWWHGGVHLVAGAAHDTSIEKSIIRGNERGVFGFDQCTVRVRNTVFSNNRNDAISLFGSQDLTIINNSVIGNLKGVLLSNSAGEIWNNVITQNTLAGIEVDNDFITADYNCVHSNGTDYRGLSPGFADINADPLAASPLTDDLHLMPATPCGTAADPTHPELPVDDLDGNPRNGVAMGAYESHTSWTYSMGYPGPNEFIELSMAGFSGDLWILMMSGSTGVSSTPFGTFLLGFPFFVLGSGICGGNGWASLSGPVPGNVTGVTVYFQALVDDELTNRYDMELY